ncbi:DivIVA domain-containing protein [Verrucosispora sp. WMMD1129]|uniref:DivIVA domain-containing protein n=1 Tax=Verrucosispora sp. WMMD1129 TaxID=3016093 RepID=UPI00249A3DA3|nr:DivIVA domain-containing protein [Verrucosispora sp. WMMD1129]WFE44774.1 DivIVA domain-containing protein [Verrucosispora sp. WMMD1129]
MELRRNRRSLAPGVLLLAFGVSLLLGSPGMGASVFAGAALLTGGWITARSLRPFRFRIGPDGLDLRVAGLNRLVPWAEIDTIVLGQPARAAAAGPATPSLLLVPGVGSTIDRPLVGRSPVDDRPALVLLSLADVRESADEVAAELNRISGGRFTDARQDRAELREGQPGVVSEPVFDTALRGYEKRMVDDLVRRGLDALASGTAAQRQAVRAELDGRTLEVALRGYDMGQVDAYLERLSAALANEPGEPAQPEQPE